MNTWIGDLGHFWVALAFVSALCSSVAYGMGMYQKAELRHSSLRFGRLAFGLHGISVLGVVATLFYIIYTHQYQYHYAWSHSSNNLPVYYMISCFWEGQEGSFLLWIFWHVVLGWILIKTAKEWEFGVMAVVGLVQAFLASMILGVVFFGSNKIGSSPFILLRDAIESPQFALNPNFVPKDGTGLNPLLQNYWMVIHPPTLFLGFALTVVPFAYSIAGLLEKKYTHWVKPALPWTILTMMVLGVGIMMGAYWAYETLNFGGYWSWDPVENAVYIPWLIVVASMHVMIVYRNSEIALKSAFILTIASFVLILYSTFLTRSGILGNSSVHSFTDLGLSGQLLVYLVFFALASAALLASRWSSLPRDEKELSAYSREFWIFMGATVLGLAAFQVLIPTSIPVFNAIASQINSALGTSLSSQLASPTDAAIFYSNWQLWAGIFIALLSGTGQFFFWGKIDRKTLYSSISAPASVGLLMASAVLFAFSIKDWKHILLILACSYSLAANGAILLKLSRNKQWKLSGGSITHIGLAIMLLGILASAGYDRVVSLNRSGLLYSREFTDELNKENVLLYRNEARKMEDYFLTYLGPRLESRDISGYLDKEKLMLIGNYKAVVKENLVSKGKVLAQKGDTIQVYDENTYYEIRYDAVSGKSSFTLFPRVQVNPQMGTVVSPDISHFWDSDLYTHISSIPSPKDETSWSKPDTALLALGDTFFVNDFVCIFDNIVKTDASLLGLERVQAAVKANIRVLDREKTHDLAPVFAINEEGMVATPPAIDLGLGVKISLSMIKPQENKFVLVTQSTQRDWIILKAVEKPLINIMWIGTLLMVLGMAVAMRRRLLKENRFETQKSPKAQHQI
jgi:cytochrome c-type biogenesis protein CcmF